MWPSLFRHLIAALNKIYFILFNDLFPNKSKVIIIIAAIKLITVPWSPGLSKSKYPFIAPSITNKTATTIPRN
jgi:hypothetical protein